MKIKQVKKIWYLKEDEANRWQWFIDLDELFAHLRRKALDKSNESLERVFTNGRFRLTQPKDKKLIEVMNIMSDIGFHNEMIF
jgi:hypothetical protein